MDCRVKPGNDEMGGSHVIEIPGSRFQRALDVQLHIGE
jgi:hypothetical protein